MREISAYLLGRTRVLLDGAPVSLPFKQAQALLYYLLVEERASRFKLADLIWGDRGDERKIRSNMRNAVYVLRKAFGADFLLETEKNVIEINPLYDVQVDLKRLMESEELPPEGYPGDFLEEFYLKDNEYFNEWVLTVRQSYNRRYLEQLKKEKAFLLRTLTDFLQGREACSLAVLGEAGIGKTYLLEKTLRELEAGTEIHYFQTRCYRAEEKYTLKPWQGIFAQLIAFFRTRLPQRDSAPFVEAAPPSIRTRSPPCATTTPSGASPIC